MKCIMVFCFLLLVPLHGEAVLDQYFFGAGGGTFTVTPSYTRSQTMTPSIQGVLDSIELPLVASGLPNAPLLVEVLDASSGLGGAVIGSLSLQPADLGPALGGLSLPGDEITTTLIDLSSLGVNVQADVPIEIRISTSATAGYYGVAGSSTIQLYTRGASYLNGEPFGTDWLFKLFIAKPDSIPLTVEPFAANQYKLTWPTTLGTYRVLYTDNLASGSWIPLATFGVGSSSWSYYPTVPANHPSRFFKVEKLD